MLEAVAAVCPELLPFALASYGTPSKLWLGDETLSSDEGVQQGDPLGPLLFCLTIQPLLTGCKCEFVTGYLDDVGLGDTVQTLIDRVHVLEAEAASLGLSLNHAKCEVVGLAQSQLSTWHNSGLNFAITITREVCLLGASLSSEGVEEALRAKEAQLREVIPRLTKPGSHEAFYLLKSCFAIPRLQYLLRCTPAFASSTLEDLAVTVKDALSSILNIQLGDEAWSQASLPIRWGGLGVRNVAPLAVSAFLSSLHASENLARVILPPSIFTMPDPQSQVATAVWLQRGGVSLPQGDDTVKQRAWDEAICSATYDQLLTRADQSSRARLLAVASPNAGAWLHALPCRNLGLCLSDRELRIAIGLRLGAPLVRRHTCVCGAVVDALGLHGLSCRRSAGRQRRHAQANDVLIRAIRAADVQAELEPRLLFRDDGKRPDGATLDPWSRGLPLVWDFTCPDTLAPSHVAQSSNTAGSAASKAEQNKRSKYAQLVSANNVLFAPVAIESLGTWGTSATDLCRDIGARLSALTGDPRSHSFLVQRLGLAVQKGNAASVAGTHPLGDVLQ